jgi:hypothetical protein
MGPLPFGGGSFIALQGVFGVLCRFFLGLLGFLLKNVVIKRKGKPVL